MPVSRRRRRRIASAHIPRTPLRESSAFPPRSSRPHISRAASFALRCRARVGPRPHRHLRQQPATQCHARLVHAPPLRGRSRRDPRWRPGQMARRRPPAAIGGRRAPPRPLRRGRTRNDRDEGHGRRRYPVRPRRARTRTLRRQRARSAPGCRRGPPSGRAQLAVRGSVSRRWYAQVRQRAGRRIRRRGGRSPVSLHRHLRFGRDRDEPPLRRAPSRRARCALYDGSWSEYAPTPTPKALGRPRA